MDFDSASEALLQSDHLDFDEVKKLTEHIENLEDATRFWQLIALKTDSFRHEVEVSSLEDYLATIPSAIRMCESDEWREEHNGTDIGKLCWYSFFALFLD